VIACAVFSKKSVSTISLFTSRLTTFDQKRKESESLLTYRYSEAKIRTTEFVLVTICLCLLQLLPIAGLTLVGKKALKVAIVLILIVAVSVLNSVFANTARAANFGAVAA
jgi:hypothetical protein